MIFNKNRNKMRIKLNIKYKLNLKIIKVKRIIKEWMA